MTKKFAKRTKIVATLGPASNSYEQIKKLVIKGANVFRLNTSHGDEAEHQARIDAIKQISVDLNVYLGIIVDLQGPKIRIGKFEGEIKLKKGQIITLSNINHSKNIIPVDYKGIANDVKVGELILIDNGKSQVEVTDVKNNNVYAAVLADGVLKERKGLNIPGTTSSLSAVTKRDIEFIKFAIKNDADYIALSFVRKKEDIEVARRYLKKFKADIPIIAKIEKPEAIKNLEEIIKTTDYVMVARGDLGIELSCIEVPIRQKEIIQEANRQRKGVIVATQMLESMINSSIPTRADASDIANAILDGADAIMLSGETSFGKFPAKAVETMAKIAEETEKSEFYKYNIEAEISDEYALTRQAIVFGADKMIDFVHPKAIISFSHCGNSSTLMSKLK